MKKYPWVETCARVVRSGIVELILGVVNKRNEAEMEHLEVDVHKEDNFIQTNNTENEEKVSDSNSKITTKGSE